MTIGTLIGGSAGLQAPTWQALYAFGFGPLDPTPLFTDITALMLSYQYEEGRQFELDRMEASDFTAVFDDRFGELTPDNTLSPFYNLLNPSDALGLNTGGGTWVAGNGTYAVQTSHVLWGPSGGQITGAGAANGYVTTANGVNAYPVLPNTQYTATAQFMAATTGEQCFIQITWYTAAGAIISGSTATFNDVTSGWTMGSVTGVSPANAAFASIWLGSNVNSANPHYFTCAMLSRNVPKDWAPLGIPVVWNQGQYGPVAPCNPFQIKGTWFGTTKNICYVFYDSDTPDPKDPMNQDANFKATDVLGLLAQAPICNTTYFPGVMQGIAGFYDLWRFNDAPGSLGVASYTGKIPLRPLNPQPGVGADPIPPTFGSQDATGLQVDALLSQSFTGSGSGALLYDTATAAVFAPLGMVPAEVDLPLQGAPFTGDHAWSCSFLANFGTEPPTNAYQILSATNSTGQLNLWMGDSTTGGMVPGELQLQIPGGSFNLGRVVTDGKWHHIVITAQTVGGVATAWIDNVLYVSQTIVGNSATPVGYITNGPLFNHYPLRILGTAALTIQDFALFTTNLSAGNIQTIYNGYHLLQDVEFTGQRLAKVLTIIGYSTFPQSIATGTVQVAAETSSQTQTPGLSYMQALVDVELGFFWQDPTGVLQFKDANYPATNPTSTVAQTILGDNLAAGTNYDPGVKVPKDSQRVFTDVQIQAQSAPGAGTLQEVFNQAAIGPPGGFGKRILSRTGLPFAADALALNQANILLGRYQVPRKRVDSVKLSALSANNIPQMIARQLWDEVRFQRQGAGESLFDSVMLIEKRTHKWDAPTVDYTVEWILSPYEAVGDNRGTFTLNNATLGILAGPGAVAYGVLG